MPGRHSPPLAVDEPTAEPLKRPKKTGSTKSKEREYGPHHLSNQELDALTGSPPASTIESPPETLSAPATPPLSKVQDSSTTAKASDAGEPAGTEPAAKQGPFVFAGIEFHHESEAEFARLLTYYGIEWQYEPEQFVLQWRDGRPSEMFSPDFYLTEYDLYIELTTMRQALVRRKNRKLRLLRALYPEINIKLLYRRDYNRLLERFGIKPEETKPSPEAEQQHQ